MIAVAIKKKKHKLRMNTTRNDFIKRAEVDLMDGLFIKIFRHCENWRGGSPKQSQILRDFFVLEFASRCLQ